MPPKQMRFVLFACGLLLFVTDSFALTPNLPAGYIAPDLVIDTRTGPLLNAVLSAPRPNIPPDLLRHAGAVRALFAVDVGTVTGQPYSVRVVRSTGVWAIDNALINTFYQWRFRPRSVSKVMIPVNVVRGHGNVRVR